MAKIAVSLPAELVEEARRAVRDGRATSVSAYVADCMARRSDHDHVGRYIASLVADYGHPAPEDLAWADAVLDEAGVPRGD
jgi:hypothetical protein